MKAIAKKKRSKQKRKIRINYRHYICVAITIGFLLCSIFVFPNALGRVIESGRDFGLSIAYYFCSLFGISYNFTPTVNEYPKIPFFSPSAPSVPSETPVEPSAPLPSTWDGFAANWGDYWRLWSTTENFTNYLSFLGNVLEIIVMGIIIIIPFVLLFTALFRRAMKKKNNNYNKDSRPLRAWKKVVQYTYIPVKYWLVRTFLFIRAHKAYWITWLVIWAYNFNLFTIVLEFIAFYLYFAMSFDFVNIYRQVYKLFLDLSPMFKFIPLWAWLILGLWLFHRFRKKIGYARLMHHERKNCGFINERALVSLICGTMGKGKTTALNSMCLSTEVLFRDKAFELLLECDMKFPNFPWINLENALKRAIAEHKVYNLATCRDFIRRLQVCFWLGHRSKSMYKCIRRHLKKAYGIAYKNICFDYDYDRYEMTYNDNLEVIDLWKVIEDYTQLYFIYVMTSSLIISNFSIRSDMLISDVGNFPLWNGDFFKRDSRLIDSFSRHAHILDFDTLRLGRTVVENNELRNSFEFGIVAISEIGKERLNSKVSQSRGLKAKDNETNQENDGFNDALKMARHRATVLNFAFLKIIADEQRAASLGADARELFDIINIRERSDTVLLMPFFALEELIYGWLFRKFQNLYTEHRYNRGDNTLFMYLFKGIIARLNHYYNRTYNTFGCHVLRVQVESGALEGQYKEQKYYISRKKDYSKRFATDCFADFFREKALTAPVGLNDLEEYQTERATWEELKKQSSYFIRDLEGLKAA